MNSLGDYLLDRTESLDDQFILDYFIERNDDKITRLLDSEQYLLEGSRGVGKTMLMKTALLKSIKEFGKNSILPVWISFEESIRLERIEVIKNSIDPFLQWTMGKILSETLEMIHKIKPGCIEGLNKRFALIFGYDATENDDKYTKLLTDYINKLEKADIKNSIELQNQTPSDELSKILDNPQSFKEFILNLISDLDLSRVVFLFDEAAHVFSHSQQEKFFTFFKTLRHSKIACKAAVYPGITNYGKYFERGQDAKELQLTWSPSNKDDLQYIRKILQKRIQGYDNDYWHKLTVNNEIIETICICSNGNPRLSFHIVDQLESTNVFKSNITKQKLINAIRNVFNTKWKEFETLKKRLIKYSQHITQAEFLVKDIIIPNLRLWNNKQRENSRKFSHGVYISTGVYESLEKVFSILDYSNLINIDYSKKSIGHNYYGYYVSINPSLIFTDLILKSISELNNTSIAIENNQAYYESSPTIKEIINNITDSTELLCSNPTCDFKTLDDSYKFCPKCGTKIEHEEAQSLYKILRSHDIDNLKLSDKIISRLKEKFNNIGDIYDANDEDIRMKYIQDVRIEKIKNAVLEYMAG